MLLYAALFIVYVLQLNCSNGYRACHYWSVMAEGCWQCRKLLLTLGHVYLVAQTAGCITVCNCSYHNWTLLSFDLKSDSRRLCNDGTSWLVWLNYLLTYCRRVNRWLNHTRFSAKMSPFYLQKCHADCSLCALVMIQLSDVHVFLVLQVVHTNTVLTCQLLFLIQPPIIYLFSNRARSTNKTC